MTIDLFEYEQLIYDKALDYIERVKNEVPFDFDEYIRLTKEYGNLLKQLRRSTRIADQTAIDLYESNLNLTDKIHYDVLTGIYNRRFLEDNLNRTIKSLSHSMGKLSVMMIDIDFFKNYNDTYGHSEGDVCLKSVAQTLSGSITGANDYAARYGGEEFIIVLPNTDEKEAHSIAQMLLENIRNMNIPHEKNLVANCITVSIGVTTSFVTHSQCGTDYIKCADEALYISKQSGRNRYTYLNIKENKNEI